MTAVEEGYAPSPTFTSKKIMALAKKPVQVTAGCTMLMIVVLPAQLYALRHSGAAHESTPGSKPDPRETVCVSK